MPPFLEKLRLDNLYPTVPINSGYDDTFDRFRNAFDNRSRLQNIASQFTEQPNQPVPRAQYTNDMPGDGRPGNVSPNVVLGNQGAAPDIARRILGAENNPATEYQKGQLDLKTRQLQETASKNDATSELNKQKLAVSQQRANVYDFKSKNPGVKFQVNKASGNLEALDPISGKIVNVLGQFQMPEDELIALNQDNKIGLQNNQGNINSNLEGQRQTGRETLEEVKARHARELADAQAANKPTGSERTVELTRDKDGNVIGAKTTTKNTMAPVTMYGPDGKPYSIPADKKDQAVKDGLSPIKPFKPSKAH